MAKDFDLSKPNRTIHAGVILLDSPTELLDVGVIGMLEIMDKRVAESLGDAFVPSEVKHQAMDIEVHWVNETGGKAKLTSNLSINATDSFKTCPPLDIVVIGAFALDYQATAIECDYMRKAYDDCSAFIAVCGGMQAPLQAGLLKGRTATCPLPIVPMMQELHPETTWVKKRFQRDGKLWTTGTLLNGLDAMSQFGEDTWGGKGSLMNHVLDVCAWPRRDVDYNDVQV